MALHDSGRYSKCRHPERSEGSRQAKEILHCAQNDMTAAPPRIVQGDLEQEQPEDEETAPNARTPFFWVADVEICRPSRRVGTSHFQTSLILQST